MFKGRHQPLAGFLVGIVAGYLVLHPYAMLIYALSNLDPGAGFFAYWAKLHAGSYRAFMPMMIPMAVAFSAFGGVIGLLVGLLLDRKRRLYAAELDSRQNHAALQILQNLTVTLAHYLLNANMIIGGKVRRCRKTTENRDILEDLDVIEEQGRRIDAVIGALRRMTEIKTADYTSDGHVVMLDIAREMDEELDQMKGGRTSNRRGAGSTSP